MPIKKTLQYGDNTGWRTLFAALWLVLLITGCSQQQPSTSVDILRVGILPDQDRTLLVKKYSILFDYISSEINIPYELVLVNTYQELLDQFHEKKINMALFGGVTFIKAHQLDEAVPLVLRDVGGQSKSVVLVSNKHPAQTIKDLKGASFSFGSRLSTSGHYMPKYFLNKQGINAEEFFSEIKYSGAHDKTALWVRDGIVDAGVSNSGIVKEMFRNGTLSLDETRILWETPPYLSYVWAIQNSCDKHITNILRNAFLKLNPSNKNHKNILMSVGAGYYLPTSIDDFSTLMLAVDEAGS